MKDPYTVLGVNRTASQDEIKSAYRKLVKELHPDLNPGEPIIEQKFKDVSAAYDVLSSPEKRAKFDRGDIDAGGGSRKGGFWRWNAGRQRSTKTPFGFDNRFDEDEDPFADIFRAATREARAGRRTSAGPESGTSTGGGAGAGAGAKAADKEPSKRPQDVSYKLKVPFVEATAGLKKRVTLSDGRTIELQFPPGTETGQTLRLKGQGRLGPDGKTNGDAYVEITVLEHEYFVRDGRDIIVDIPVTLDEAVLGGSITVPTIHGNVSLRVPRNSNSGTRLRLKGKGVPATKGQSEGDQYVTLKIMLPEGDDPELTKFLEEWRETHGYNPRHRMKFV